MGFGFFLFFLSYSYCVLIFRAETGLEYHDDVPLHKKEKPGVEDRQFSFQNMIQNFTHHSSKLVTSYERLQNLLVVDGLVSEKGGPILGILETRRQ